jgi:hypothetical protein
VTRRFLVQLVVLIALTFAPFGRIGMTLATDRPAASHCGGQMPAGADKGHRMDCTIACACIAEAPAPFALSSPAAAAAPSALPPAFPTGIHPGADPPPPRAA